MFTRSRRVVVCTVLAAAVRVACAALLVGLMAGINSVSAADPVSSANTSPAPVSFREHIQPILRRHCYGCHAGAERQGGLRLDRRAEIDKGGDGGPVVRPGKPAESPLFQLISGDSASMPKNQPRLSAEKVELIRRWIEAGAVDDSPPTSSESEARSPDVYRFAPAISSVALSPDGKLTAAACRSEVVLVPVEGEAPPRRLPTGLDQITEVQFSPSGELLAISGGSPGLFGELRFVQVADGLVVSGRRIGFDALQRGGFSPDGATFAVAAPDGSVYIVPVDPAGSTRRLELHSDWAMDAAFSPDGTKLISGGRDKATKISSVESGRLLRAVDASPDFVTSVAANNEFAFSSGRARTLFGFEYKIALEGVQIAGDGNGAQPVNRRDQYARPFEGQPAEVLDLAMSGDRKILAAAGNVGEIRVYDAASRQRVATIANVPPPVFGVALDAAGARLAAGTRSGQLMIFELPSGKPLKSLTPVPVREAGKTVAGP